MTKLTIEHIEGTIAKEEYINLPDSTVTLCCLTLQNGFVVVGKSACIIKADYDPEIGRTVARGDAVRQIWGLEGYLAVERLAEGERR